MNLRFGWKQAFKFFPLLNLVHKLLLAYKLSWGLDAKSSSERVTAWASMWGIHQFQQFGGAPITIWRELRKTSVEIPEGILQKAFEAADKGNWAGFLVVMGGPAPLKKDQPIHIAKTETSELGKYGDPIGKKFIGLTIELFTLPSRTLTWEILNLAKLKERLAEIFGSSVWDFETAEAGDGGTDALAQRTDICGEAALEFCQ